MICRFVDYQHLNEILRLDVKMQDSLGVNLKSIFP